MLQIITEKFYRPGARYETLHRATFYTNYRMYGIERLETPVGVLLNTAGLQGVVERTACHLEPEVELFGVVHVVDAREPELAGIENAEQRLLIGVVKQGFLRFIGGIGIRHAPVAGVLKLIRGGARFQGSIHRSRPPEAPVPVFGHWSMRHALLCLERDFVVEQATLGRWRQRRSG